MQGLFKWFSEEFIGGFAQWFLGRFTEAFIERLMVEFMEWKGGADAWMD